MAIFSPHTDVERVLDLSAFRIDWDPKIEVRYVEVEKVVVMEKNIYHYYYKIDNGTERVA
jgi:hypothetical protein